jgi:hypothetical protein
LAFQTGVILPSIGLLNELHEPPLFFGVERPDYAKYIIPTTWFGNGAAIYGNYNNFNYRFTVMEGLNANKISYSNAIRNGRQKGYKSKADDLLYNGSIEYLGLPGLKVGASVTYNNATGDSNNIAVTLLEAHFKYAYNNLMLVGEFGNISYGSGNLKTSRGYYFDLGYDVSNIFGVKTQIIPFARYTNYNTAFSTIESGDSEKMFSRAKWMIGMNILPISEVVFKIDYSETEAGLTNQITKNFNLGVGYMF